MRGRGKQERGSALLMIMIAVTVIGVLFGGLYVALSSSHRQAIEHELQVQAEFDAQKMMEIALHYFYQGDFEDKFSGTGRCLEAETDPQDKVCLSIEENGDGVSTHKLLTATGVSSAKGQVAEQTRVIQLDLLAMDGTEPPRDQDSEPSPGQSCFDSNERLPLRALAIGSELDLTKAKHSAVSDTVNIEGGLYIPEGERILLPSEMDHKFINIHGLIYDADNLPDVSALGAGAMRDTLCYKFPSFHDKVKEIADRAINQNQKVPVYTFESTNGIVTLDAIDRSGLTLREVLAGHEEKIVVVKGKLVLGQTLNSRGYLVVYDSIELPSGFVWQHSGAILTDAIAWPNDYELTIKLSKGQAKLYEPTFN